MSYQKKCLRCGAESKAERWPGKAMVKTMCRAICKEITTHHFREKVGGLRVVIENRTGSSGARPKIEKIKNAF